MLDIDDETDRWLTADRIVRDLAVALRNGQSSLPDEHRDRVLRYVDTRDVMRRPAGAG